MTQCRLIHSKSIFITATINTHDDRDGTTLDIPVILLHELTKVKVIRLSRGPLAETMVLLDLE